MLTAKDWEEIKRLYPAPDIMPIGPENKKMMDELLRHFKEEKEGRQPLDQRPVD